MPFMRSVREIQGGKWRVEHLNNKKQKNTLQCSHLFPVLFNQVNRRITLKYYKYKQNVAITVIHQALWLHHRTPDKRTLLKHFLSSAFLWDDQGHSNYGAMRLSDNGSLILIRPMPKKRTRINCKLQKNLFLHVNKCQEIQYSHTVHPQLKP